VVVAIVPSTRDLGVAVQAITWKRMARAEVGRTVRAAGDYSWSRNSSANSRSASLMAAEVLFVAAADEDMPRFLQRKSAADVPTAALLMSTILIQIMLVVAVLSEDAFNFALVILAISVIGAIAGIVALDRPDHYQGESRP
jgi:hypothetical protein